MVYLPILPAQPCGVSFLKREDWDQRQAELLNVDVPWFTDCSKTDEGVGIGISGSRLDEVYPISLKDLTTIFQAEAHAIEACVGKGTTNSENNKNILGLSSSIKTTLL